MRPSPSPALLLQPAVRPPLCPVYPPRDHSVITFHPFVHEGVDKGPPTGVGQKGSALARLLKCGPAAPSHPGISIIERLNPSRIGPRRRSSTQGHLDLHGLQPCPPLLDARRPSPTASALSNSGQGAQSPPACGPRRLTASTAGTAALHRPATLPPPRLPPRGRGATSPVFCALRLQGPGAAARRLRTRRSLRLDRPLHCQGSP